MARVGCISGDWHAFQSWIRHIFSIRRKGAANPTQKIKKDPADGPDPVLSMEPTGGFEPPTC